VHLVAKRPYYRFDMMSVRRRHVYGLGAFLQQRRQIRQGPGADLCGEAPGGFEQDVCDADKLHPVIPPQIPGVHPADVPGTENAYLERHCPSPQALCQNTASSRSPSHAP
jgi:hypothetical protein